MKKPFHSFCFLCQLELDGIDVVIFDAIPGSQDLSSFETGNRPYHLALDINGQTRGQSIWINLNGIQSFGEKVF